MSATPAAQRDNSRRQKAFRVFLRVYGVLTLAIFVSLFVGFIAQSPLLAEHGGALNWTIWNDVRCGSEHLHVPPMLMVIYIVWGIFLLRAAGDPRGYDSFLNFTMWANLAHGALMAVQAGTEIDHYWSKFLTDIPFVVILALGIYLWRRAESVREPRA
jgi:FtsH-binding integral membrane protein